jgi:hypothetical protein
MIFDAPGSYIRDAIRGLRQNGNPVGSGYKGYSGLRQQMN